MPDMISNATEEIANVATPIPNFIMTDDLFFRYCLRPIYMPVIKRIKGTAIKKNFYCCKNKHTDRLTIRRKDCSIPEAAPD